MTTNIGLEHEQACISINPNENHRWKCKLRWTSYNMDMSQCGRSIRLFTLLKIEIDSIAIGTSEMSEVYLVTSLHRKLNYFYQNRRSLFRTFSLLFTWNWCLRMEWGPESSWLHFTFYLDSCNLEFGLHPQICVNGSECTSINGIIRFSENKRNSFHSNPKWITVHVRSWQTFSRTFWFHRELRAKKKTWDSASDEQTHSVICCWSNERQKIRFPSNLIHQ